MKSGILWLLLTASQFPAYSASTLYHRPEQLVEVNITVLNTFAPDTPSMILGLDYDEANDRIALGSANAFDPEVGFYNPDDGSYLDEVAYSSPLLNFGVCLSDDGSQVFLTEWSEGKLYTYDWTDWSIVNSPAGTEGRGMDYRDGYLWVALGLDREVMRFLPDGTNLSTFSIPQPYENLSGLASFPLGSNTGIILTSYYDTRFFFYSYNGSTLSFLTAVDVPVFCNTPLGLTYSGNRGTFFWSYTSGATYTISELDIEIELTALQRHTFGFIKSSFQDSSL